MSDPTETTPLNGENKTYMSKRRAGYDSGVSMMYTSKAFFCLPLNIGMMVVLALDIVAFIVFLISFIYATSKITGPSGQSFTQPANGAALALSNGIFFLVGGIALAVAVFVKQRGAANVCCLVGLFFHALVAVLLLPQWIWQAVNWADSDNAFSGLCGNLASLPAAFGISASAVSEIESDCNKYQFAQAFGTIFGVIFWLITPHMFQIANAWRHEIIGSSGLKNAFDDVAVTVDQPKDGETANPAARKKDVDYARPPSNNPSNNPSQQASKASMNSKQQSQTSMQSGQPNEDAVEEV